jgi:hypothetical protein
MSHTPPTTSKRLFDVATTERLAHLTAAAVENGLALSIDFLGPYAASKTQGSWWIVQLFDSEERQVVSGRGSSPHDAVYSAQQAWLARTAPTNG